MSGSATLLSAFYERAVHRAIGRAVSRRLGQGKWRYERKRNDQHPT